MESKAFRLAVRVLQLFPALLLACAFVGLGIEAVEFFTQPVNQLIPVQSALNGK